MGTNGKGVPLSNPEEKMKLLSIFHASFTFLVPVLPSFGAKELSRRPNQTNLFLAFFEDFQPWQSEEKKFLTPPTSLPSTPAFHWKSFSNIFKA